MIDLYTFPTPNGWKASIMLEEVGLPYTVHIIDIMKDEQFGHAFLKISPNNKIPAIVDPDGPDGAPISVFESGAILMYLARKTNSPLLPEEHRKFVEVTEWLMFQMASIGPMFGQMGHFVKFAKEDIPYAKKRYTDESRRILGVMNTRLADNDYLAGEYSIADIASYGWTKSAESMFAGLGEWENVNRWFETVGARPAVQKGLRVPTL
ncbi:MAG: glutathione S-transferase N-terminal domain-containing protein [Rhodospirillaceae bacterium]